MMLLNLSLLGFHLRFNAAELATVLIAKSAFAFKISAVEVSRNHLQLEQNHLQMRGMKTKLQ